MFKKEMLLLPHALGIEAIALGAIVVPDGALAPAC
jgi:hypothetical protein